MVHQPLLVEAKRRKFDNSKGMPAVKPTKAEGGWKSEEERQRVRREVWANALGWTQLGEDMVLAGKVNLVVGLTSLNIGRELTAERDYTSIQHPAFQTGAFHQLFLQPKRIDRRSPPLVPQSCMYVYLRRAYCRDIVRRGCSCWNFYVSILHMLYLDYIFPHVFNTRSSIPSPTHL